MLRMASRLSALLLPVFLPTAVAHAATLTISFTGTIVTVAPELASALSPGQAMSGSLQIDSTEADTNSDPSFGSYRPDSSNLVIDFGSYSASLSSPALLAVLVTDTPFLDSLLITFSCGASLCIPATSGPPLQRGSFWFYDTTGTVFSSDALPTTLDLSDFNTDPGWSVAELDFGEVGTFQDIVYATFLNLSATVPEPGSAWLISAALLAVLGSTRGLRGHRQIPSDPESPSN